MGNIAEVTFLYEISKVLGEHLDLKKSLYKVLEILSNSMQMVRGTVCLRDPVQDEIVIEVAHGLSETPCDGVGTRSGKGSPERSSPPAGR